MRMPLPPPPAAAFTRTGKLVSVGRAPPRPRAGTTGTPAATATSRAWSLRPIVSITSAEGPTKTSPASTTAWTKAARSERKP